MISQLRILDLIVVKEANLELAFGLNVLTGSTGSGKSVLLAALSLLSGERGRADWIREGCDRAVVEALLEIDEDRLASLAEIGIDVEDGQISLKREIKRDGKGRAFIDGSPASVAGLRRLGELIFERQDQHDQMRLLDPNKQLSLLDDFGDLSAFRRIYQSRLLAHRELIQENIDNSEHLGRLQSEEEYLRFQLNEIETLDPKIGEIEELTDRERQLRNSSKIAGLIDRALALVDEDETNLRGQLLKLDKTLQKLNTLSSGFHDPGTADSLLNLEELALSMRARKRDLSSEVMGSDDLTERLNHLHALERKHGKKLEELLSWSEEIRTELDEMAFLENERKRLFVEIESSATTLSKAAIDLSRARKTAAKLLGSSWQERLGNLGMDAATLQVEVIPRQDPEGWIQEGDLRYAASSTGMDAVRVLVRTNPDSREGTLRDIPSGGELSRIALACRLLPGQHEGPPVLVLDEVDAGLGADIAPVLAEQLLGLAIGKQVLLVTHQPVLAAVAGRQFNVDKQLVDGQTRVEVRRLDEQERLVEIIRMLGGEPEDREVREHAEFLLARAGGTAS